MWSDLRDLRERLWGWIQGGLAERREVRDRERFWTQVREGENEAEHRARPAADDFAPAPSDRDRAKVEAKTATERPSHEH